MNSQSYIDLAKRIRAKAPMVKTIDIFNNQYEEPGKHDPFVCPAVFVEWMPTDWQDGSVGVQEGEGAFRIHCVMNTMRSTRNIDQQSDNQAALNLLHLDFPAMVHQALQGFAPTGYSILTRRQTQPDQRFTGNIVFIHEYRASVVDTSAFEYRDYIDQEVEDFTVEKD